MIKFDGNGIFYNTPSFSTSASSNTNVSNYYERITSGTAESIGGSGTIFNFDGFEFQYKITTGIDGQLAIYNKSTTNVANVSYRGTHIIDTQYRDVKKNYGIPTESTLYFNDSSESETSSLAKYDLVSAEDAFVLTGLTVLQSGVNTSFLITFYRSGDHIQFFAQYASIAQP